MRVNDFFCGGGGLGLGFIQAGFDVVGAWDLNKHAVQSYAKNVDDSVICQDVQTLNTEDIPQADVWTFGFPCTDISTAGKQRGMIEGVTRSGLFFTIMRKLDALKEEDPDKLPFILLAENVKNVRKYLPTIEREYAERGYKMYVTIYNSSQFKLAQNRERYFILGVREGLPEFNWALPPYPDVKLSMEDFLEPEVDIRYFTPTDYMQRLDHDKLLRLENFEGGKSYSVGNSNPSGKGMGGVVYSVKGLSPCITLNKGLGNRILVEVDPTNPDIYQRYAIRRTTPREVARLQGFPDDYAFTISPTQLYQIFGNAVSVPVAKYIAEQLKEYLSVYKAECSAISNDLAMAGF